MDAVTDILAFAATHADYWTEFLSGQDYSAVLSGDEMKALEAADRHVREGIYDLLLECGKRLEEKLKGDGVVTRNFQRDATARNRVVRIDPPKGFGDRLYGLEFALVPDDKNEKILLYPRLVVKKGSIDKVKSKLASQKTAFQPDDYYLYGEGVPLEKDASFATLAGTAATTLAAIFQGAK
jgi:hypothetical protein